MLIHTGFILFYIFQFVPNDEHGNSDINNNLFVFIFTF